MSLNNLPHHCEGRCVKRESLRSETDDFDPSSPSHKPLNNPNVDVGVARRSRQKLQQTVSPVSLFRSRKFAERDLASTCAATCAACPPSACGQAKPDAVFPNLVCATRARSSGRASTVAGQQYRFERTKQTRSCAWESRASFSDWRTRHYTRCMKVNEMVKEYEARVPSPNVRQRRVCRLSVNRSMVPRFLCYR